MCMCVSLASDSLETVEVIIVKLGSVTASEMGMHQVLVILFLTFIQFQGHTDFNHENYKCLIISETIQAMPIKFAVKTVATKMSIIHCQSDDLDLYSRPEVLLKLDYFLTCNNISWTIFKLLGTLNLA